MTAQRPIYLDYAASTPIDPRVCARMQPWLQEEFGNPGSTLHAYGWAAEEAVEAARREIARLIGAQPKEIIFTSGATEANNLALKGVAIGRGSRGKHLISIATEHPSVLTSLRALQAQGFSVTLLRVNKQGLIDLVQLQNAIRADTFLVSVMAVNHETGIIQDIAAIGALCHERGVLFHVDAAQAAGKIEIDVHRDQIDLLSLSAHKLYGPKGIGALFIRRHPPIQIAPLIHGGGQECGLRSGTLPTHQIVGMGEAFRLARSEFDEDNTHARRLRDILLAALDRPDIAINGSREQSIAQILNLRVENRSENSVISALSGLAVSNGSACRSAETTPSPGLLALGLNRQQASNSVRLSFGRMTTETEIRQAAQWLQWL